jgi:hypothetical protein
MRYLVSANGTTSEFATIEEARTQAVGHVQEAMDSFGEDREALRAYGFLTAEELALDMPEEGGTIRLANGTVIEVRLIGDPLALHDRAAAR